MTILRGGEMRKPFLSPRRSRRAKGQPFVGNICINRSDSPGRTLVVIVEIPGIMGDVETVSD